MLGVDRRIGLGIATGVALAVAPQAAEADTLPLTHASPNLPTNAAKANQQLDTVLDAVGPDSCLAISIGDNLGIKSAAERAQFINSGNISLIKKQVATSKSFSTEIGCDPEVPVKSANTHTKTMAYKIVATKLPAHSIKAAKKSGQGYEFKQAVLAGNGDVLTKSKHSPKNKVTDALDVDVSFGVGNQAILDSQEIIGQIPSCAQDLAAKAVNASLVQIQRESFNISGKKMSLGQFQAALAKNKAKARASLEAAAQNADDCSAPVSPPAGATPAPLPSPAPTPTPEPTPDPGPPIPPAPVEDPFAPGNVGVDMSQYNCGVKPPAAYKFGVINVTGGVGYSTNSCLAEQLANFKDTAISFYVNTGWYNQSTHINANSPKQCAENDQNCLAYNYGYNAGVYAVGAITSLNFSVNRDFWLDVEDDATWDGDAEQHRNSIQGERDALMNSGAKRVGIYSTTALWNSITGNWKNNWVSWGATTWDTAAEASTYCTGHEFTGGTSVMMQFKPNAQSNNLDQNVVCGAASRMRVSNKLSRKFVRRPTHDNSVRHSLNKQYPTGLRARHHNAEYLVAAR